MSENLTPNEMLEKFGIKSKIKIYGNGHINDTYCTEDKKYILQRINTDVFKNPNDLMSNVENVTEFLKKKILLSGGDPERETLTVVKTLKGENYLETGNGCYRVYKFISDTNTVECNATKEDVYNAGTAFGHFQNLLSDFPVEILNETIKDFHNTPKRVEALKKAIETDLVCRAVQIKDEIDFALKCAEFSDVVINNIANKTIPLRVTHNDTKINNILFDNNTGKVVCVIDLDTVMQGSMLYDFGDALRMAGSNASEDETDLSKVTFNVEAFKFFSKGYLEEMKGSLTETEIELLPFSVKLMTYECGIRFLTDYLNGDKYFKIHRENHNLDRARNQFKLVYDISQKEDELKNIIKGLIK